MRVAVYARYSSDHQREASIEDQIEVCRRYVERLGWTIAEVYADQALNGPAGFGRRSSRSRPMPRSAGSMSWWSKRSTG
jgi:DNA invertase Pin-like site-specific DNA recombinase